MGEVRHGYTEERNAQILIALLKAHGIRRVIASPGSTHMAFLGSVQYDPWFRIWSAVDERHAAYMAVGMATESGESVVLTCTGSTASRNYLPALTEAYYRKLPVLAVTGTQVLSHRENLYPQFIDRSVVQRDAVKCSVHCPLVYCDQQARDCELALNKALLELRRHGGGPVHINLEAGYSRDFTVAELPTVRRIDRYEVDDELPSMDGFGRIAVYIGDHKPFRPREEAALRRFLETRNAIAVCHASSSWHGPKRVMSCVVCSQGIRKNPKYADLKPDLIVHIGEMSNDYTIGYFCGSAPVWRVSADGEAKDRFGTLAKVFEMPERMFFDHYAGAEGVDGSYGRAWAAACGDILARMPELPFSNLWIARQTLPKMPKDSVLMIGVSSTLQNWTTFLQDVEARTFSNVGTCGIDGCVSTLVGASLCDEGRLYFGVVGDLTFFYDMNALGNRHIGRNLRLLVVNNGCGGLFHTPGHVQEQFGDDLDEYMAAGGHFGRKSPDLVRHLATDLGFRYVCASDKDGFAEALPAFLDAASDRPVVFECFTDMADDRAAWGARTSIDNYVKPKSLSKKIKGLFGAGSAGR